MNVPSLVVTTLLVLCCVLLAKGQEWSRDDFNVAFLKLIAPFDSIYNHLHLSDPYPSRVLRARCPSDPRRR